uniref:titin-like isoform X1 n=1 Tax=Styela clava TaxID=7725 RepID=UPI001939287D|nr:titin-like isoform X1 [Styela clava]
MSLSKKRAAPRPPVPGVQSTPAGKNKENEKILKKENGHGEDLNMNENIILKVVMPDQTEDEIEVPGLIPLMDLRMQLCAKYKLSPSSYKLEPIELDGRAIPFTQSSTVVSINAKAVALKTKAKEPVKIAPPKVVEQTVRLTIRMSQSHKQVLRVRPNTSLDKLLPQILEKSGFKPDKHQYVELRHPDQPTMTLDTSRSLDDYKIREIFVADKRVPIQQQHEPQPEPEPETMSIQSDDTSPDKISDQGIKKSGSLKKSKKLKSFFRLSKKSKHSPLSSPPTSEQSSSSPPIPQSRSPDTIQQPQFANVNENNSKQREDEHKVHKKKKAPIKHPEPQNEPLHGQVTEKIDEPQKAETIQKQNSVESEEHIEDEEVIKIVPPRPNAPPRVKPRQQPVPATRLHATGKKKAPPPPTSPDSAPASPTRPSRPEKPPRKHSVEKSNKDRPVFNEEKSSDKETQETVVDDIAIPMQTSDTIETKVEQKPPSDEGEEPAQKHEHEEIIRDVEILLEKESEIKQKSEVSSSEDIHEKMGDQPPQIESADAEFEKVTLAKPVAVPRLSQSDDLKTESANNNEIQTEFPSEPQKDDSYSVSISSAEDMEETPADTEFKISDENLVVTDAIPIQDEVTTKPEPEVENHTENENKVDEKAKELPPDLELYATDMKFDISERNDDDMYGPGQIKHDDDTNERKISHDDDVTTENEHPIEIPEPVIAIEKEESSDDEAENIETSSEPRSLHVDHSEIDSKTALADEDNLFTTPSHYDPNFGQVDAPEDEFDFMAAEELARSMITNFNPSSETQDDEFPSPPPPDDFDNQPTPPPPTPSIVKQPPQQFENNVGTTVDEVDEDDEMTKQKIEELQQQINMVKRAKAKKKAEEEAAKKQPYTIIEEKQTVPGEMQKPGAKTFTFVPNQRTKKVYESYETAAPAGINLSQSGEIRGVGVPEPQKDENERKSPQAAPEKVEPSAVKPVEKSSTPPPQEPIIKQQPVVIKSSVSSAATTVPQQQPVVIKEKEKEPQKPKGVPANAPPLPKGLSGYVASAAMKRQNVQSKPYVPSQAAQDEELSSSRKSSLPNYYKKFLGIKALQFAAENKDKEDTTKKPSVITSPVPEEKVVPNGELSPKPDPPKKPEALKSGAPLLVSDLKPKGLKSGAPPPMGESVKPQEVKIVEQTKNENKSAPVTETIKIEPVTQLPLPPEEKSPPKPMNPVTNIDDVPLPPPPEEFLTPANTAPPTSLDYSRKSSASSTSSTKSPGYSPRSSNFVGISAAKPFSPGGGNRPKFRPMSAAFKDDANNFHPNTNYDELIWNHGK